MLRRTFRRRGLWLAATSAGVCLQTGACLQDAQLFPLRVAYSSITLPFNQWVSGAYAFASNLIAQTVVNALLGI